MNAELFIHGPRHAFYGKQEESQYCQLFDNSQIKDEKRFVVEIRRGRDGKRYVYYNYCRYANILDIDGRNGAYIGLTIRLDEYYSNLYNLFSVLDVIFNAKVVGLLVKKSGNNYQYIVSDFRNSQQLILDNIERNLGTLLTGLISQEVFPIDSSFATDGIEVVKGLDDNKFSDARMSDIKKTGKLVFTPSKEIDRIEETNKEKQSLQGEILQRDKQIASLTDEKTQLEETIKDKERQIAELISKNENITTNKEKHQSKDKKQRATKRLKKRNNKRKR